MRARAVVLACVVTVAVISWALNLPHSVQLALFALGALLIAAATYAP